MKTKGTITGRDLFNILKPHVEYFHLEKGFTFFKASDGKLCESHTYKAAAKMREEKWAHAEGKTMDEIARKMLAQTQPAIEKLSFDEIPTATTA